MKMIDWREHEQVSLTQLQKRLAKRRISVSTSTLNRLENGLCKRPDPELCKGIEAVSGGRVLAATLMGLPTR